MKDFRDYMRVGIVHHMAFPHSLQNHEEFVESIKGIARDTYFDVIEVRQIKDPKNRDSAKRIIEESKLNVAYSGHSRLNTNGLNINDLKEEGRVKAVEELKEGIDEAIYMGAETFAFLSGRYEEETKEESLQALIKSTRELCEYAKKKGKMKVLLEVFDYNIAKKCLLGPIALVERYVKEVGADYENFGIMVDLSHLPMLGETPRQNMIPIRKYIKHVHIGNTVIRDKNLAAYGDEHPRFGFPNSENDVEEVVEFLRVLLEIGYLNIENPPIVSFEVKPWGDEDPEIVIANAKRTLNEALARL